MFVYAADEAWRWRWRLSGRDGTLCYSESFELRGLRQPSLRPTREQSVPGGCCVVALPEYVGRGLFRRRQPASSGHSLVVMRLSWN